MSLGILEHQWKDLGWKYFLFDLVIYMDVVSKVK